MSSIMNSHWILAVLAMMFISSYATIVDTNITLTSEYIGIGFAKFMFGDDGKYSFTLHKMDSYNSTGKPLMVLVDYYDFMYDNPCKKLGNAIVKRELNESIIEVPMNSSVSNKNVYAAILFCESHPSLSYSLTAIFMNGNSHLSTEDLPLPIMYIVVVSLWAIFLGAWLLNWIITRHITKLHIAISCFIVLKLITVVYLMVYWIELNKIGVLDYAITIGFYVVEIIEMVAFFSVLLLIGVGWGMIDDKPPRNWPLLLVLVVLYGLFFGLSLFIYWFAVASIILLCVLLYVIYTSATKSRIILTGMIDNLNVSVTKAEAEDPSNDTGTNIPLLKSELEHCNLQRVMLTRFCFIMMGYLIGRIIQNFILIFVSLNWVDSFLTEVLDIALFACIGWVFRLRPSKKEGMYFLLENEFEEYGVPMSEVTTGQQAPPPAAEETTPSSFDDKPQQI